MFDKYVLGHGTTETKKIDITVNEHRAPTDASIALLKEFEKKIEDKILFSVPLNNNTFSSTVYFMKMSYDHSIELIAVFKLNGRETKVRFTPDMLDLNKFSTSGEKYKFLVSGILRKIAEEIAEAAYDSVMNSFDFSSYKDLL